MAKSDMLFSNFILNVLPPYQQDIEAMHQELMDKGFGLKIEQAKSGPVLSYLWNKRTVANYVFRKTGMLMRLYAENVAAYESDLSMLPAAIKKTVAKAPICKRLMGTAPCSSNCPMGYTFKMDGENYQKCRYGAFLLPINDDSIEALLALIRKEANARISTSA